LLTGSLVLMCSSTLRLCFWFYIFHSILTWFLKGFRLILTRP
jgi:hypothetical protein